MKHSQIGFLITALALSACNAQVDALHQGQKDPTPPAPPAIRACGADDAPDALEPDVTARIVYFSELPADSTLVYEGADYRMSATSARATDAKSFSARFTDAQGASGLEPQVICHSALTDDVVADDLSASLLGESVAGSSVKARRFSVARAGTQLTIQGSWGEPQFDSSPERFLSEAGWAEQKLIETSPGHYAIFGRLKLEVDGQGTYIRSILARYHLATR
jgi:hypothetical protein